MNAQGPLDLPVELLLLRHGKSSWQSAARDDFDRPLASRGKRDAPRMGRWLRAQDLVPDFIVSSPARRARQTARRAARAMGLSRHGVELDDRLYEASLDALLEVIEDRPPEARRMLLVGHNPAFEQFVRGASDPCGIATATASAKLFPTAALAHIRAGALVAIIRPRTLERETGG